MNTDTEIRSHGANGTFRRAYSTAEGVAIRLTAGGTRRPTGLLGSFRPRRLAPTGRGLAHLSRV